MKILVIVDAQRDFVTGPLGTPEAQAAVPVIAEKRPNYNCIFYTRDTHTASTYLEHTLEGKLLPIEHCMKGTPGWCIVDELNPRSDGRYIIDKRTFGSEELVEMLKNAIISESDTEIHVCGFCTDICVIVNCLLIRTHFPNIRIIVDAKACAGTTPEKHRAALEVMKSCQIEVINDEV